VAVVIAVAIVRRATAVYCRVRVIPSVWIRESTVIRAQM
jgi:hypothetical protein